MAQHSIRLVRAGTLEFPQFKDAGARPLVLRPDAPLAIVSDEVLQNELIQNYLAQGTIVLLDEEGKPLPPPAAPEIKSDAERGEGIRREERAAGANPEDSTKPAENKGPNFATSAAGLPQRREERPAGANPEDGTRSQTGGMVSDRTGLVVPENPTRADGNAAAAQTEEQRRKRRGTNDSATVTSSTSPRTREGGGDPASADEAAPSAIDTQSATFLGAASEGAHQQQSTGVQTTTSLVDSKTGEPGAHQVEANSDNTTSGVASPQAGEELAGSRTQNTSTVEGGSPNLQDNNETTGHGKKRRH